MRATRGIGIGVALSLALLFAGVVSARLLTPLSGGPVAAYSFSPPSPAPSGSVTFDCSPSSDTDAGHVLTTCTWTIDGTAHTVAYGTPYTQSFATIGSHSVTLTVADDSVPALTDSQSFSVPVSIVDTNPVVDAGGPYTMGYGQALPLSGTASDADIPVGDSLASYRWQIDGVTVASGTPASQPPDGATATTIADLVGSGALAAANVRPGTHTVTLRVTDSLGGSTTSSTSLTMTADGPVPYISGPSIGVSGQALAYTSTIYDDPGTTITSEAWTVQGDPAGVSIATPSADATTIAFGSPGDYTVTFTAHDDGGRARNASQSVHIASLPTVTTTGPYRAAPDGSVAVSASASADSVAQPVAYQWSYVDASSALVPLTSQSPSGSATVSVPPTGVVRLVVTATDALGQQAQASTSVFPDGYLDAAPNVGVNGPFSAYVDGGVDLSGGAGDADVPAGDQLRQWTWTVNGVQVATGAVTPQPADGTQLVPLAAHIGSSALAGAGANTPGAYPVTLTVTDALGGTTTVASTLTVSSPPSYTLSLDHADGQYTVPAGEDATLLVQATGQNGFVGSADLFLNGPSPGDPTPAGIYQNGPASAVVDGLPAGFSIHVDATVAPGAYSLTLNSSSGAAGATVPFTLTVAPAVPHAYATAYEFRNGNLGSSSSATDGASAADTIAGGSLGFRADLQNFDATPVTQPGISLNGVSSSLPFSPALPSFPIVVGGADLGQGGQLSLDRLDGCTGCGHSALSSPVTMGYDAQRTVSPLQIAPGGGTQHLTVSVTLRDARLAGQELQIEVDPNGYTGGSGASIVGGSVVVPSTDVENVYANSTTPNQSFWSIGNAQLNKTYTLTLDVAVANVGTAAFVYKPQVHVYAIVNNSGGTADGTTAAIHDDRLALGNASIGTYTFSSNQTTHWNLRTSEVDGLTFNAFLAPPYTIGIDRPTVSVPAGGSFTEHTTLTAVGSFTGDVNLYLSGGQGPTGSLPVPSGIAQNGPYPQLHVDASTTPSADLTIATNASLAPGTYTVYLAGYANLTESQYSQPITITVTAALPQASAMVQREGYLELPSSADSISAGTSGAGWTGWWSSIYNFGSTGTISGAQITATRTATSPAFDPPATFPYSAGPQDVGPGQNLQLNALSGYNGQGSPRLPSTVTAAFDVQRSVSPATLPASGGTVTVTVSVTPRDPALANGQVSIAVQPNRSSCCTTIQPAFDTSPGSVTYPTLGSGEGTPTTQFNPSYLSWWVGSPVIGKTYTLVAHIVVPAGASASYAYKPYVQVYSGGMGTFSSSTGTSGTVSDPVLGGSFRFASTSPSQWSLNLYPYMQASFADLQPPSAPQVHVGVSRDLWLTTDGATDAVSATQPTAGTMSWFPYVFNVGTVDVDGATISADTTSQTFTPALSFPHTESSAATLHHFDSFSMNAVGGGPGNSTVDLTSTTTGFDAARTVSPTSIPPGGAIQTVTATVTPQTATANPSIYVDVSNLPGATIVPGSVVAPSADPSGAAHVYGDATSASWGLQGAGTPGTAYTLTLQVDVPNGGAGSILYKPDVQIGTGQSTPLGPDLSGTGSTTIADPVFGGTFTFGVSTPGTQFTQRYLSSSTTTDLSGVDTPIVAVDHFRVVVGAGWAHAGSDVPLTVVALDASNNPVTAYAGPVALADASGSLVQTGLLDWANGVAHGLVQVASPFHADSVTATDLSSPATGQSAAFNVVGALAGFRVTTTQSFAAGSDASVTAVAQDGLGQTIPDFAGVVAVADDTGRATLTSGLTWSLGVGRGTFQVPVAARGDHLSVSSGPVGSSSGGFSVLGAPDHLVVRTAAASVAVNAGLGVTITEVDAAGNTLPFAGPVTVADTTGTVTVPAGLSWSAGAGTGTVRVATVTAADRLTVTGGGVGGQSGLFTVYGAPDHIRLALGAGFAHAGAPLPVTVSVYDASNDIVSGYSGAVTVGDTSGTVSQSQTIAFSGGVGRGAVTVPAPYNRDVLTATTGGLGATSAVFNVVGPLVGFRVTTTTSFGIGTSGALTIIAQDALGQSIPDYPGSAAVGDLSGTFAVADPIVWSQGVGRGSFQVSVPYRADRLSVVDGSVSGSSGNFNVIGPVASFRITVSPTTFAHGGQTTATVVALDAAGNTVPGYAGAAVFRDLTGTVSGGYDLTWAGGVGTAHIPVGTAFRGDRITVTDPAAPGSPTGTSNTFTVT